MPQVASTASREDRLGTVLARSGLNRDHYRVTPGLYAVGHPDPQSPVLVTANYKLSFDALRFSLDGVNAWLLVADSRGVNVWCAAGKGTFSTAEIVLCVKESGLAEIVHHRTLILPQLGATGVSAHNVRKDCGFKVLFGPVQARDLPAFLQQDNQADEAMRRVSFTLGERLVLIPVEIFLLLRPLAIIALAALLLSGIGPTLFSLSAAWQRGVALIWASLLGIFCGSVLVPIFLPWLPGRQFWIKGLWPGLAMALLFYLMTAERLAGFDGAALVLWIVVLSSYQAMNFTGCTPYASPSGVEYEMRRGIPVQAAAAGIGIVLWLSGPFIA